MFKIIRMLVLAALAVVPVAAQQFQTSDLPPHTPLYATNAKYVNGWSPGYAPTGDSTGLTLTLSSGTNLIPGTVVTYAGGTLSMTDASTNYVYLDNTGTPGADTIGFVSGEFPLAIVVTSGGNITSITDIRGFFFGAGGSGPCSVANGNSVICDQSNQTAPNIFTQEYGFQNNLSNTAFTHIQRSVAIGNNNMRNSTGTDAINIGNTTGQSDSSLNTSSLLQEDTILMGDNTGQTFTTLQDDIALGDFTLSGVAGTDSVEDVIAIGDEVAEGLQNFTNEVICIGFAPCQIIGGITGAASESIFLGDSAGQNSIGTENIGIGDGALRNIHGPIPSNTGASNVAIGLWALATNHSGSDNVAIGSNPGCVGCTNSSTGQGNISGSHNVWIGDTVGQSVAGTTEIDYSIAIGYKAQNDQTNETVIGSSPSAGAGATALAIIYGVVEINGGTNVVLRCATAGALPVGALTLNAASCGTTTDTGLRVQ